MALPQLDELRRKLFCKAFGAQAEIEARFIDTPTPNAVPLTKARLDDKGYVCILITQEHIQRMKSLLETKTEQRTVGSDAKKFLQRYETKREVWVRTTTGAILFRFLYSDLDYPLDKKNNRATVRGWDKWLFRHPFYAQEFSFLYGSADQSTLESWLLSDQKKLPSSSLHVLFKRNIRPIQNPQPNAEDTEEEDITSEGSFSDIDIDLPKTDSPTTQDQSFRRQIIYYGPPGTGKSHLIAQELEESGLRREQIYRITFHPEYGYHDFIGSYRPMVGFSRRESKQIIRDGKVFHEDVFDAHHQRFLDPEGIPNVLVEPITYYDFDPGPLSLACAKALKEPNKTVVLIIEEINRGNCAAIFGDIFQLLDRCTEARMQNAEVWEEGWSEYPIVLHSEWAQWFARILKNTEQRGFFFQDGMGQLRLPPNLHIKATMNTSDQGLFPMDSAFRRRWFMKYIGIRYEMEFFPQFSVPLFARDTKGVAWNVFLSNINQRIITQTDNEDKQLGPYYIHAKKHTLVNPEDFQSKVLFYLWNTFGLEANLFHELIESFNDLMRCYQDWDVSVFHEDIFS